MNSDERVSSRGADLRTQDREDQRFVDLINEENLLKQINRLSQYGILLPDGRVVKVDLFEFHDLVAICSLVCNNNVSPMGNNFFPWCICHKKSIHMVTDKSKFKMGILFVTFPSFMQYSELAHSTFTYLLKVY